MSWQTNNSFVVSQGPCTAHGCKSSDAKTHYSDGHAYCFSCHTYFPAEFRVPMEGPHDRPKPIGDPYPARERLTKANAPANWDWLKDYGLTDEEIDQNFFFGPYSLRHVWSHTDEEGKTFYEARSVSPYSVPKSIQYGDKPTVFMGRLDTKIVVVVEDVVSAIKVGRHFGTLPLFGSYFSPAQMAAAKKAGAEQLVLWMDCDKYSIAMGYARQAGALLPTAAIQTKLDPKAHSDEDIILEVEDALEALEV